MILDLFSRKIISCRVSLHNSTQLISAAFKAAYASRNTDKPLMFHSDQGANYTSKTYQKLLRDYNVEQSFSKSGVPYDNSVVESFFKNMKQKNYIAQDTILNLNSGKLSINISNSIKQSGLITILITKLLMRQKTIITKGISLTEHLN